MSAPSFVDDGTGHETSVPWGTHTTGDLGLLFVEVHTENVATPTGWTPIPGLPIDASVNSNTRLFGFYRFATSAAEGNVTIPGVAVNHAWGAILVIRNAHATAPFHTYAVGACSTSTTAGWFPPLKTLVDDCMIVNVLAWHVDNAGPIDAGSTGANADLANLTKRHDSGTATNDGGGILVYTGDKAAAGDVRATLVTLTSTAFVCATIAIAPKADKVVAPVTGIEIAGVAAPDGGNVAILDKTQPAASYLCTTGTTSGGTFSLLCPYDDHDLQAVFENGASYGASAVDQAA